MDDDLIGTASDDDYPRHQRLDAGSLLGAPALAVAAAVMAFAAFSGYALLSGSAYLPITYGGPGNDDPEDQLLLAGLLGVLLCAIPLLLGLAAVRRTTTDDPSWAVHLGRGAVVAAAVAAVLKLVAAVAQYVGDGPASGIT